MRITSSIRLSTISIPLGTIKSKLYQEYLKLLDRFQYLLVRLKGSSTRCHTACNHKFQYLLVRLKGGGDIHRRCCAFQFQYLLVRLKGSDYHRQRGESEISIPLGTIKSICPYCGKPTEYDFNTSWYD